MKSILFMFGVLLMFMYVFPPLHLINDENRKEKEKKLNHIVNLDNMSRKQKVKMFSIMLLGFFLTSISFLFF